MYIYIYILYKFPHWETLTAMCDVRSRKSCGSATRLNGLFALMFLRKIFEEKACSELLFYLGAGIKIRDLDTDWKVYF